MQRFSVHLFLTGYVGALLRAVWLDAAARGAAQARAGAPRRHWDVLLRCCLSLFHRCSAIRLGGGHTARTTCLSRAEFSAGLAWTCGDRQVVRVFCYTISSFWWSLAALVQVKRFSSILFIRYMDFYAPSAKQLLWAFWVLGFTAPGLPTRRLCDNWWYRACSNALFGSSGLAVVLPAHAEAAVLQLDRLITL